MRADTHDGPEQMLHVRGLIHCCSSHVRRSWNSVLQRTAGPYMLAHLGRTDPRGKCPHSGRKRTRSGAKTDEEATRREIVRDPSGTAQTNACQSPTRLVLIIECYPR